MMIAVGAQPGRNISLCLLGEAHTQHCLSVVKKGFPCYRAHHFTHKQTCSQGRDRSSSSVLCLHRRQTNRQEQKPMAAGGWKNSTLRTAPSVQTETRIKVRKSEASTTLLAARHCTHLAQVW